MTADTDQGSADTRSIRQLPRWADAVIGAALLVLGLVLLFRPFASIALLLILLGVACIASGVADLVRRPDRIGRLAWVRPVAAVLLILLGIVVLLLPGLTLRWAVILLAAALLVQGLRELVTLGAEPTRTRRWAQLLSGLATIVFGVLALTWRDVTVLVVGVLFGIWLVVHGVRRLLEAVLPQRYAGGRAGAGTRAVRSWPQLVLSAVSLALAVLLAVIGGQLLGTHPPDAFYTPPQSVPREPGKLLRAEPFTRAIPQGARAWRILYTTTRAEGVPAIASGLVVMPDGATHPPTIAWAHGTTGVAVNCAPTLLADPFTAGGMPDTAEALARGWAIVATDYVGLGVDAPHPYLVGEAEGRSVLDAVRASRQLADATFDEKAVVWGHSQGGGAALWTGGIAASYAPELDLVGVAAMAPAANLPAMIGQLADEKAGTIVGPLVLAGYSSSYDDVRVSDYLRPEATLMYDETIARCWSDPSFLLSVLQAGALDRPLWIMSLSEGALAVHLEANVPRNRIGVPLLIAQGSTDTLVLPEAQRQYVDSLCRSGQPLDYRSYAGKDHMGVVTAGSPLLEQLMSWTEDRLLGRPAANTC